MAMNTLLHTIPSTAVLSDGERHLDRAALDLRIGQLREALAARRAPSAPVAILADNSPEWLAIDLATHAMGITLVPLPLFFTPAQWHHVLRQSGAQALFCASADQAVALGFAEPVASDGPLALFETARLVQTVPLPNVQKITFTSGTTSAPKGVCLSGREQWGVAEALRDGLAPLRLSRHLCLLPFAVLLENVAGAYTALLTGATTICPPLAHAGLHGASGFDAGLCLSAIERHQPHSVILVPQMLQALVAATRPDDPRIRSLRFVAVGGGKTPGGLLRAARARAWPVYEGYGLSECASVTALNLPGAQRAGSVGRPLKNRRLRIAGDGEILVQGVSARYLGQEPSAAPWLATGDLGHLDDDGYLYVDGRKKDILITAYGRNVSPEWPEAVLVGTGAFAQALVVGEAQPHLGALLVPARHGLEQADIQRAVDLANAELPDYAQVRRWVAVPPFTAANDLATANGRLRRARIHQYHATQIASLFAQPELSK